MKKFEKPEISFVSFNSLEAIADVDAGNPSAGGGSGTAPIE